MIFITLIFLQVSGEIESRNYCNIYMCTPTTMKMNASTCIYPDILHSTYYLQLCTRGKPHCIRDFTATQNITCSAIAPLIPVASYPGEGCEIDKDCVFGYCLSGVCFASNPNENCTDHGQCNPGLRCSKGKCTSLLKSGESGCESDFDCDGKSGCNKNATTGLCVPYFSLRNDARVSRCTKQGQGGYSYLCQTGVCLNTNIKTAAGICSQAPISVHDNPKECFFNSDCKGFTDAFNYTGSCVCGVNQYAASYCQPFIGDLQGIMFMNSFKIFLLKGFVSQCNTARRYSEQCWKLFNSDKSYLEMAKNKFVFDNYPKLQNNDVCIQTVFFNEYYENDFSFGNYISGLVGFAYFCLV